MLISEKRFGLVAIEKGFITKDQLHKALIVQVEKNVEENNHMRIGDILIDLGYISKEQAEEIFLSLRIG